MTGCKGQIGIPLVKALTKEVGEDNIIATDISDKKVDFTCREDKLDITDFDKFNKMVKDNKITYIVHLGAILSALGEKMPDKALNINVNGTINALNIAREHGCQIFIPSTIASFGGDHFLKD